MGKIVRRTLNLQKAPKLTRRQKAEIAALAKLPDARIDYSDIPPLDEAFWRNAGPNLFYKPKNLDNAAPQRRCARLA